MALSIASLALTWSQMLLFLYGSYVDSASRARVPLSEWTSRRWLGSTQLFEEAWGYVCATPERWWWSSQICLGAVGVWTPFLWSEGPSSFPRAFLPPADDFCAGRRHKVPYPAAYMLLGQIVAISFASGLFLLALPAVSALTAAPTSFDPKAPAELLLAVIVGQATTFAIPYVSGTPSFLFVLGAMHIVLFWPLLPIGPTSFSDLRLSDIYIISTVLSSLHYLLVTFVQLPELPSSATSLPAHLFKILAHHPAQASVSLDVLCFTAITFVWIVSDWRIQVRLRARATASQRKRGEGAPSFMAVLIGIWTLTPLVGPAGTFAAYLAWRERTGAETERLKRAAPVAR